MTLIFLYISDYKKQMHQKYDLVVDSTLTHGCQHFKLAYKSYVLKAMKCPYSFTL